MAAIAFHDPRLSSTSGGGETVTLQLVAFLLAAGHDVTVVTRKAPRSPVFEATVRVEARLQVFEVEDLAEAGRLALDDSLGRRMWSSDRLAPQSLGFNIATRNYYESHAFDLVVVSFIPDLALLATRAPVLLNIFGLPPNRDIASRERPLLDRCRRISFASTYTKREFLRLFGLEGQNDPGPVCHASVQLPFFDQEPNGETEFDACFIGRLTTRKGLYPIVEAVAWLAGQGRRVTLAVAGAGQERHALAKKAQQLGIAPQMTWLGALGPADVVRTLDRSRCYLSPSLEPEAFACGNLEAMARGVPVITTNLGGTTDYVRPGENALTCDSGSASDMARAIDRVLADSDVRARLRAEGQATAGRFHPSQVAPRWLTVFDEALRPPV